MSEENKQEQLTVAAVLAMKPGQELDVLVAQRVMGHPSARLEPSHPWEAIRDLTPRETAYYAQFGKPPACLGVAEYSTSMNAAWAVMKWLREWNCDVSLESHGGAWAVHMAKLFDEPMCETAPEAICKAALLLAMQHEGHDARVMS